MTYPVILPNAHLYEAIADERARQERMRREGRFQHTCASVAMTDHERSTVLVEEVGEVARAVLEKGKLANDKHGKDLRKELIQVAAVAVAWLEGLDAEERAG